MIINTVSYGGICMFVWCMLVNKISRKENLAWNHILFVSVIIFCLSVYRLWWRSKVSLAVSLGQITKQCLQEREPLTDLFLIVFAYHNNNCFNVCTKTTVFALHIDSVISRTEQLKLRLHHEKHNTFLHSFKVQHLMKISRAEQWTWVIFT